MPTFCRNEGECSKRLRGESEWRFFVSEKCLKTRLLRACVLVALFLPFFFSFLDVCVLSWPADIVFSGCLALDERVQHTDQKTSNILSKVSPHNLASHHHRYQTHEKSFHAFQREREFRCAEQQQQQRLLFHRLCFFLNRFIARARACIIYARRVLILITRRMALLFPMWCDDDRRKKNTRVSPFSRERRRQKRRIAKDNTVVAVVCRAR